MGKTPKPLQLLIPDEWMSLAVVTKARDQGHLIVPYRDVGDYTLEDFDAICGPGGWRVPSAEEFEKNFELIVRGARALRYPKGGATGRRVGSTAVDLGLTD